MHAYNIKISKNIYTCTHMNVISRYPIIFIQSTKQKSSNINLQLKKGRNKT